MDRCSARVTSLASGRGMYRLTARENRLRAMASHETVDLTTVDSAARILLNRPEALNAWNEQFGRDLLDAVTTVADDESIRALLVTGAGRGFSSGADLKEQRTTTDGPPDLSARLSEVYHPIITGLREMPKPVVAAVNGPAVGIGCSLALAADLIVAAESAYFLLAFVNIGLVPDGGSTAFLPARIGYARAAEMAMLGERVPAEQALDWGLVNRVVPDGELESASGELLDRLARGPTRSYAGAKRLLNRRMYAGLAEQLEAEADTQRAQGKTQDFIEGVLAFAEKRPPNFTGK
jgi:2-(1,2-epoxy-1,2-dihydrophenyl)acetyl-CoA isomerase